MDSVTKSNSSLLLLLIIFVGYTSTVRALTPADIKEINKKSMVFLEFDGVLPDGTMKSGSATGYILDDRGYILTNYHAIPQDKSGKFDRAELRIDGHAVSRYSSGMPVDFIDKNETLDLALLKFRTVEGIDIVPIICGESAKVNAGDKVVSLGFPLNIDLSVHTGNISTTEHYEGKWVSDLPLNYGDSGGPVFNIHGEWVAIAKAGITGKNIENIKTLIPRNHAKNLIDLTDACTGSSSSMMIKLEEIRKFQQIEMKRQQDLEIERKRIAVLVSTCKSQAKPIDHSCTAYDRSGFHSSPSSSCILQIKAPRNYFFAKDRVIVTAESYRKISGASAVNAVKPKYRTINGKKLIMSFTGRIGCTNSSGTGRTCKSKATIKQVAYPLSCIPVVNKL